MTDGLETIQQTLGGGPGIDDSSNLITANQGMPEDVTGPVDVGSNDTEPIEEGEEEEGVNLLNEAAAVFPKITPPVAVVVTPPSFTTTPSTVTPALLAFSFIVSTDNILPFSKFTF